MMIIFLLNYGNLFNNKISKFNIIQIFSHIYYFEFKFVEDL